MQPLNHLSRRYVSALCAIALIATSLAHAFAQQPATSKRPITHKDYDSWHSIQSPQISRDGKFVAYAYIWRKGGFDWAHQDVTPSEPEEVIERERALEEAAHAG